MKNPGKSFIVTLTIVAVVATVIGGLMLLDSPAQERMRRLDEHRVADLRAIEVAIKLYWSRHETLPVSLEKLSSEPGVFVKRIDTETARAYEYQVLGSKSYELCANFVHDTAKERDNPYKDFWSHGLGRQCFHLEAEAIKH